MEKEWLQETVEELGLRNSIEINDIPDLDLYMDQLITLFESKLSHTKRYEEDKLLTKTMINNYTKDKVLMPAHKKKYTKDHIILMIMLYQLKNILSISDIKDVFEILKESDEIDSKKLASVYQSYLLCKETELECFKVDVERRLEDINATLEQEQIVDESMSSMLLVLELIEQAVYLKKLAEKIIDEKIKKPIEAKK